MYKRQTLKAVPRTREDVAFLQYTGGTTGVSKGATLLNRNIIANMLQVEEWMQPAINTRAGDEQINFVCALPLYHIFALTVCNMIGIPSGVVGRKPAHVSLTSSFSSKRKYSRAEFSIR